MSNSISASTRRWAQLPRPSRFVGGSRRSYVAEAPASSPVLPQADKAEGTAAHSDGAFKPEDQLADLNPKGGENYIPQTRPQSSLPHGRNGVGYLSRPPSDRGAMDTGRDDRGARMGRDVTGMTGMNGFRGEREFERTRDYSRFEKRDSYRSDGGYNYSATTKTGPSSSYKGKEPFRGLVDRNKLAPSESAVFDEILGSKEIKAVPRPQQAPSTDFTDILNSLFSSGSSTGGVTKPGRLYTGGEDSPGTLPRERKEYQPGQRSTPMESHIPKPTHRLADVTSKTDASFDLYKETIFQIQSDVEILAWAEEEIFGKVNRLKGNLAENEFAEIYPLVLAHLISLFRDRFKDSHSALSLFEHAKNLSAESYICGCSTSVYNEMLQTRWKNFRDLQGIEMSIREMRMNGVGWDRQTSQLIGSIVEELGKRRFDGGDVDEADRGLTKEFGEGFGQRLAALEKSVEEAVEAEERRAQSAARRRADDQRAGADYGGYEDVRVHQRGREYDREEREARQYGGLRRFGASAEERPRRPLSQNGAPKRFGVRS